MMTKMKLLQVNYIIYIFIYVQQKGIHVMAFNKIYTRFQSHLTTQKPIQWIIVENTAAAVRP